MTNEDLQKARQLARELPRMTLPPIETTMLLAQAVELLEREVRKLRGVRAAIIDAGGPKLGKEAEELRQGLEELMESADAAANDPYHYSGPASVAVDKLQELLDRVDARDCVARAALGEEAE